MLNFDEVLLLFQGQLFNISIIVSNILILYCINRVILVATRNTIQLYHTSLYCIFI